MALSNKTRESGRGCTTDLREAVGHKNAQILRLQDKFVESQDELKQACNELERLRGERDKRDQQLAKAQTDMDTLHICLKQVCKELECVRGEHDKKDQQLAKAQTDIDTVKAILWCNLSFPDVGNYQLHTRLDASRIELNHARNDIESAREELQDMRNKWNEGRLELEASQAELQCSRLNLQEMSAAVSAERARGAGLIAERDEKETALCELRVQLEKMRIANLNQTRELLPQAETDPHPVEIQSQEPEGAPALENVVDPRDASPQTAEDDDVHVDTAPPELDDPSTGPAALSTAPPPQASSNLLLSPSSDEPVPSCSDQAGSDRPAKIARSSLAHTYTSHPAFQPVRCGTFTIQYGSDFQASVEELRLEAAPGNMPWGSFYKTHNLDGFSMAQVEKAKFQLVQRKPRPGPMRVSNPRKELTSKCLQCLSSIGSRYCKIPKAETMSNFWESYPFKDEAFTEAIVRYHNTAVRNRQIPGQWMGDGEPDFIASPPPQEETPILPALVVSLELPFVHTTVLPGPQQ
ncbi:hypothetical protein C8R45DRAFT_926292 [Mycena sanguinolenta]|nr:hypothetical protein C8R45DRAFT_926292 [Mycena sanguinolenta]